MSENKNPPRKNVDQVFARGKTVKVAVETKKKTSGLLNIKKPGVAKGVARATSAQPSSKNAAAIDTAKLLGKKPSAPAAPKPAAPSNEARLSEAEREARLRALSMAQAAEGDRAEQMRVQEEQRRAREEAQAQREAEERAREAAKREIEEAEERAIRAEETRGQMQQQAAEKTGGDPLAGGRIKQAKNLSNSANNPPKKAAGIVAKAA